MDSGQHTIWMTCEGSRVASGGARKKRNDSAHTFGGRCADSSALVRRRMNGSTAADSSAARSAPRVVCRSDAPGSRPARIGSSYLGASGGASGNRRSPREAAGATHFLRNSEFVPSRPCGCDSAHAFVSTLCRVGQAQQPYRVGEVDHGVELVQVVLRARVCKPPRRL